MVFAIPFTRKFQYPDQNIQWNIYYSPKVTELNTFVSAYGSKRINLIIEDFKKERDIEIIQALIEVHPECEIVVCLPKYSKHLEETLNNHNLKHYYNEFVTTWDKFNGFLNLKVTDIFIAENLAFSAKILKKKAKEKGISLRSFCNVCESDWEDTPSLKTFFIRPEDVDMYEDFIDTLEFYIPKQDGTKINTFYEIYAKDKKWFGKLKEIIIGYKGEEDNRFLIPPFGERRLNCGQRCLKDGTCSICERIADLGVTLKEKNLILTPTEEQEPINGE